MGIRITRLFTGDDGRSHFEDRDLPLEAVPDVGGISNRIGAAGVFFRDTGDGGPDVWDYHVAPRRQFVIHLAGTAEIEVGDGTRRTFGPGEVLLADDTTGQGHISREVEGPRRQIFVPLADDVDVEAWPLL